MGPDSRRGRMIAERKAQLQALANEGLTIRQASDRTGVSWEAIWKFAATHGITFAAEKRRCRVSKARFAAMWADERMTREDIARAVGSARKHTATELARAFGLPRRQPGERRRDIDLAEFRAMYAAGVGNIEMAAHFGVHRDTIWRTATRLRLPQRGKAWTPKLSLADYRVKQNVQRMAETARAEQAARVALQKALAA